MDGKCCWLLLVELRKGTTSVSDAKDILLSIELVEGNVMNSLPR